jgi:hypothetical protein
MFTVSSTQQEPKSRKSCRKKITFTPFSSLIWKATRASQAAVTLDIAYKTVTATFQYGHAYGKNLPIVSDGISNTEDYTITTYFQQGDRMR